MTENDRRKLLAVPLGMALFKLLLHLPVLHRYGFHHDEWYFIACGSRLSFGYVDHPPLVPWIARLATTLFGDSLVGLRIFATLAGTATVFLIGILVARLGGGRFAQALACLAWIAAPVSLRTGNMLAIPSFEPLFWVGCSLLLVHIVQRDAQRLWPWLGLVAGIGLLNKHSMLFFGFGLAVAMLVHPTLRRHLRTPWPWIGAAVAAAIVAPNVVWQIQHGWPTLGFLRNLNETVMAGISKIQFVVGQVLYLNPLASFVWICGLVSLFRRSGRQHRYLGTIWLAVFLLLLATDSKIYYLSPAYPAIVAAGGSAIERWTAATGRRRLRPALVAIVIIAAVAFAPLSLPYLSIDATDRFVKTVTLGQMENVYELTGDLHGMFGWQERLDALLEVWEELPEEDRSQAVLLASGYANAGLVDFRGREHGLPEPTSFAQTWWLWADDEQSLEVVVTFGHGRDLLDQIWEEVTIVKSVELDHVNPWVNPFEIAICRKPKLTMQELWPQVRPW